MLSSSLRACVAFAFLCLFFLPLASGTGSYEVGTVRELIDTKEHGILSPGAACALGGGAILITDRAGRTLFCFSREGKLLWRTDGTETGEKGFLDLTSVASSNSLSLFVLDRGTRKILRFDGRGAFQGYVQSEDLRSPTGLALGEAGELYLWDSVTWQLVCVDVDGSSRWGVKAERVTGDVRTVRAFGGEIQLLVPEKGAILRYGRFGEYIGETRLSAPGGQPDPSPTSFSRSPDGNLYVTTRDGRLLVYDALSNPVASLETLGERRLEVPCDLFVSGKMLYLLDCGSGTLYEIALN